MSRYWKCSRCNTIYTTEGKDIIIDMCVEKDITGVSSSGICRGELNEVFKWECSVCGILDICEHKHSDSDGCFMESKQETQEETSFPVIDKSSKFYKNCKSNRKNNAKICQCCPFKEGIEEQELVPVARGPKTVNKEKDLLERRIANLEKQNSLMIQMIAINKRDESYFNHNHNVSQSEMDALYDELMPTTKIVC